MAGEPGRRPPSRVRVRASRSTGAQPRPPSSKYYTLRYTLAAFLAAGESAVHAPALSDDTDVLVEAVRALGGEAAWEPSRPSLPDPFRDGGAGVPALRIHGVAGQPVMPAGGVIQVGNAGAVLRLLLGLGAMLPAVRFETNHPDSLGTRPNADLLAALAQLGIVAEARQPDGRLPITLRRGPPRGGDVSVSGARSSQYLSALLYLAPLTAEGLRISVTEGLRSAPLVQATLRALAAAGIVVEAAPDLLHFAIPGAQTYQARVYSVPGDGPSAAALVAAALALDAPLRLERLEPDAEDVRGLLAALAALGAPVSLAPAARPGAGYTLTLAPGARLRGARVDGDACIDSVPALVAAACFAEGETRFERVATLRLKESDRIGDLCAELSRAGCDVTAEPDAIVVRGRPEAIPGGVTVSGHHDHRLVQALAIVALRSRQGLTIEGADHVAKSYPWFFADLAAMGAEVEALPEGPPAS